MAGRKIPIELGEGSKFDLALVGDWVNENIWLVLLIALIGFLFWIFQKGGFAEKWLEYRIKGRELDKQQLDATRELTNILQRKYERDNPLLPFDDDGQG